MYYELALFFDAAHYWMYCQGEEEAACRVALLRSFLAADKCVAKAQVRLPFAYSALANLMRVGACSAVCRSIT